MIHSFEKNEYPIRDSLTKHKGIPKLSIRVSEGRVTLTMSMGSVGSVSSAGSAKCRYRLAWLQH